MIAQWSCLSWQIPWTEYVRERFYWTVYVHNCKSFFTLHCCAMCRLSNMRQLWRKLIEKSTWQQLTHYGSDTEHIMLWVKGGRYMFRFWHRIIHFRCFRSLHYPVLWSEMFKFWISGILMRKSLITPFSIWVQDHISDNSNFFFVNKFSPSIYSTNILPTQELED